MLDKLDFMMRFWDLKARHESLGAPLLPVERVELLSLLSLMATDDPLPEAGPPPRSEHALEAQITRSRQLRRGGGPDGVRWRNGGGLHHAAAGRTEHHAAPRR